MSQCGKCLGDQPCNKMSGECPSGCQPNFKPPHCSDCSTYFYLNGDTCEKCGRCKNKVACSSTDGSCPGDCESGYQLPYCKLQCDDGNFGVNCLSQCGKCFGNQPCNKTSGECPSGCQPNFISPYCSECEDYKHGTNCNSTCGNCLNNQICNKTTGKCLGGCSPPFKPPYCKDCEDGKYGSNCDSTCGLCVNNETCDTKTGACSNGCSSHFEPPNCIECSDYFYLNGSNCEKCGRCKNNVSCSSTDGRCPGDCESGYQPPYCKLECAHGKYGANCLSQCGKCLDNQPCNKTSGECPRGCQPNFISPHCSECSDYFYLNGTTCENCGRCENNVSCSSTDGRCPGDCESGYQLPYCKLASSSGAPNLPFPISGVAGGVSAVVLVILIAIIVVVVLRRRGLQQPQRQTERDSIKTEEDSSFINIAGPLDPKPEGSKPQKVTRTGKKYTSNNNNQTSNVYVNTLPQKQKPSAPPRKTTDSGDTYYSVVPSPIPVHKLGEYIRERKAGVGFDNEYKLLPYGIHDKHEEGKKPENKKRNRFLELFPYDHSRVVLKPDGDADWDYINANYITGFRESSVFIAAQGPNSVTVDDFWRMIWQENVAQIVMLTRLKELTRVKCEQYWPDENEDKECGNIKIHLQYTTTRGDYTIRRFSVVHKERPSDKRVVTQLHFTSWPDHYVPSAPALVSFWKQYRILHQDQQEDTGPVVVHCSAGVGRTGTFIALDSLFDEAESQNKVNVFSYVNRMRKARMNMVQTSAQYCFVHEVVLEAIESKNTFYTLTEFDTKFGSEVAFTEVQENEIFQQYKRMDSMRQTFTEKQVSESRLPENVDKNRDQSIVPEDMSRPFLTTQVKGQNQYINAVVLPSYTSPSALIVTQTPLTNTVVDFWRLVLDHECFNIVCLENDIEDLYPSKNQPVDCGPFRIILCQEKRIRDSFTQTQLTLTVTGQMDSTQQITVYRPNCERTSDLLDFVNEIEMRGILDEGKMLVHCNNGSRLCGLFCGVLNIITRLRLDKEVDIFLTIRELQCIRPQFINSFDQYKFCFEIVKEYQRSTSVYANI